MKKLLLLLLCLIPTTQVFASFGYSQAVVIQASQVGGAVATPTNFQVDFDVTQSGLKTVGNGGHVQNANGYDISMFSDSTCSTQLALERELYNASTGKYTGWTKVPALSTTTNTTIYLCYGDSSISTDPNLNGTYGATSVWTGYNNVWHLPDGTTLSIVDSTGNSTGTNNGAGANVGKIDGALNMNGTNYVDGGSGTRIGNSTFTLSYWVYWDGSSSGSNLDMMGRRQNSNVWFAPLKNVSDGIGYYDGVGVTSWASTPLSVNTWTHLLFSSNAGTVTLYMNGVNKGTNTPSITTPAVNFLIGRPDVANGTVWTGREDEVRLSATTRTQDWDTTEYNNQSATSTFYTLGAETPIVSFIPRFILTGLLTLKSLLTIQ